MSLSRAAALAACVALLGCSDNTSLTEGPNLGGTLSRHEYASRLAEWICDDLAVCCDASAQSFDHAACVATYTDKQLGRLEGEERAGLRGFDAVAAAECQAALEATPADCSGSRRRARVCFQTYDGLKEVGEQCQRKAECRGSRFGETSCIEGRCAPRGDVGTLCSADGCDACSLDTRCRQSEDGESRCYGSSTRQGGLGDSCSAPPPPFPADATTVSIDQVNCPAEDGLHCSNVTGRCEPFVALGGTCQIFGCEPGTFCLGGVCVPAGEVGAECQGFRRCGEGAYCRYGIARCDVEVEPGRRCSGFELFDGRCTEYLAEGDVCQRNIECPNGPDEDCVDDTECGDGLSCTDEADGFTRCRPTPDGRALRCERETRL